VPVRVLVTGGAGYLGSTLVPLLLDAGHEVTVLDRFFFGTNSLPEEHSRLRKVRDDVRWCDGRLFDGQEAVVDLAALSNDPAGAMDPWKTYEINYLGRVRIARLAREAKVARYVVSSSCSIYGFQEGMLSERSETRPLTAYARANVMVEADNVPLNSPTFCSTALRFATLYGVSRRMRFDLAINGMALGGIRSGRIPVMRDGNQWRPFLHVRDAARAIVDTLVADPAAIGGQAFNVGSEEQNFQIRPLADLVAGSLQHAPTVEWYGDPDARSYQVDFSKFRSATGFAPAYDPPQAVRELETALTSGSISADPETNTVDWYRHLLSDAAAGEAVALRGSVL
jgi:nucleoside-diphosphate-sugar epimerase